MRQASETALNKLLAALPALYRRDAEYVRQRIHVDAEGWHHSEENVSFLPTLQEAVWQERRLEITYHLSTGPVVECLLDPLGLVAKGNVWYLVATYGGQIGVYRVSRVLAARVTERACIRPQGFDLAAFWEQSSASFRANRARYSATVRAAPAALLAMRCLQKCEEVEPPDGEGWVTLALQFESEEEACGYVLSLGPQIEVLEPQALRARVRGVAENTVALYARKEDAI